MKGALLLLAAVLAGFAGGLVGRQVAGQTQTPVRGRGFELVDGAGQVISFWGIDQSTQAVLAFGARGQALGGMRPKGDPLGLRNLENQVAVFGLQGNDSPMLKMNGSEGKRRVSLMLSQESKPVLALGYQLDTGVLLGIEQSDTPGPEDNNWGLIFPPERVRISMGTKKEGDKAYVWGYSKVNGERVPKY